MKCIPAPLVLPFWALLCALTVAGCAATFSPGVAREISRDRLLQICETGKSDHLSYRGSDFNYHYVFDSRPGKERTYKVRISNMKLADTFSVGDDAYVLLPWVIEGQLMGSKPNELQIADSAVESTDRSREVDDNDANGSEQTSRVRGAAQPVVERPAQADLREGLGDDQIETGRVQTP
jgi:hypothetical protein